MEQKTSVQRIKYLDMAKGLATFFVVWGHVIQYGGNGADFFENKLFVFIYSFHMPLFFYISGFLYAQSINRRTLYENIKNKVIHIVFPAVIWGVIYYLIKWGVETVLGSTVEISISECVNQISNIWFLWTVFMCMVTVAMVEKIFKVKSVFIMFIICMIVFNFLPFKDYNMFLFPYFVIGYYYDKKQLADFNGLAYLSIVIYPLLLLHYNKKHFIYTSGMDIFKSEYGIIEQINIDLYRWLVGLSGCFALLIMVKFLSEKYPDSWFENALNALGRHSLEIYVMQRIVVEYLGAKVMWKVFDKINFFQNELIYNYVYTLIFSVIFIFILYYITIWIKRITNYKFWHCE